MRITEEEAAALARFLGLHLADFHERFTRLTEDGATGLVEKPNHECVFWSRTEGCTVYPVRPRQCRTWPFWRRNLGSPLHWEAASRSCPGIGRGELHDAATIARTAEHDGTSGWVQGLGGT